MFHAKRKKTATIAMKTTWKKTAQDYLTAAEHDPALLSSVGDNPFVDQMEREIETLLALPAHRVVAVSSATAGMVSVLRALGIGRGDEVIVPAFGWGQTLNPVLEVGATPVFVDVEADGVNLDLSQIEVARTHRTKAVLAAELFGIPLDWRRLDEISRRTGGHKAPPLFTVVDAAQSFGAVHEEPWPTAVVFSFGRGKLICGGEGGAVATQGPDLHDAILLASQHPIRVLQNLLTDLPFDAVDSVAPNARIHPFAAALVAAGVKDFCQRRCQYRQAISKVRERLMEAGFPPVPVPADASQAPPVIPVRTDRADDLLVFCQEQEWKVRRCPQKPLVLSPTVKKRHYLPALGHLGFPQRRIAVRHVKPEYPEAFDCAQTLYLIDPLASYKAITCYTNLQSKSYIR
jgi:dTDP-4-amino-4,6-dideoxygalactose transaminase